jgi:phage terminase large subunit-like protein
MSDDEFESLSPDPVALRKIARRMHTTEEYGRKFWAINYVNIYPKVYELFELGATCRERLFKSANQSGKSFDAAIELSYHLTGRYPGWWKGHRFDAPIAAWICSETALMLRDVMQKLLFGEAGVPDALGTGTVPLDLIGPRISMARSNIPDAYDTVRVKHVSGGWSSVRFRSYAAGREAFQGVSLDFIVFDEEPPLDIYAEGVTRISARRGGRALHADGRPRRGHASFHRRSLTGSRHRADEPVRHLRSARHAHDPRHGRGDPAKLPAASSANAHLW